MTSFYHNRYSAITQLHLAFTSKTLYLTILLLSLLFGFEASAQCGGSTAPSSISGSSCVLYGGTTLVAEGGSLGQNGIYQWGTGTVAGQNIISSGQWVTTQYVNPTNATTYWLRIYNPQTNCATPAVFKTVTKLSSPPTHIEWIAPVCSGVPFTLTALGGQNGTNSSYQWGTGAVGTNIIASQTGAIATFTATANTTYWARRFDGAPCNSYTDAVTFTVTIIPSGSTPPTTIAVSKELPLCPADGGATLTAVGGSSASGATYQWGTGNVVGSNILPGQTSQTMWVPANTSTTYWVRRVSGAPCGSPTSGVTLHVPVATYSTTPTSISESPACSGGTVLTAIGGILSPGASYQWGTGWSVGANVIPGATGVSLTVNPASQTVYWVRTVDPQPCYQSWMQGPTRVVNVAAPVQMSTAPTGISGTFSICQGSTTTLTANGGIARPNSVFQWGTGNTIGNNVLPGTTASINVSPNSTTVYWVRRYDSGCNYYTAAIKKTVTVSSPSASGSLSAARTTVCSGTAPSDITLTGNGGPVIKWQRCNNSSFVGTVTDIASTLSVLTGNQMGPISSTTYYRAVIQGSCSTTYTSPIAMTIPAPVTYSNGSWNGTVTESKSVIITDDITINNDLSVCSCKVTGTATVTILSGKTFTVQKSIEVTPNANIIVEPSGSILQINDAAVNTGSITYKRQTTAMRAMDFTYWSAPVSGSTLYELSPQTRHDKFMSFDPIVNSWAIHQNGAAQMTAGKGYIVRAPENWSLTNATQGKYTAEFTGTPNNGIIPVTIKKGAGTFNLIGNPYPSAIDIDLFLTDPANEDLVNGTIYLWSHNTAISSTNPGAAAYNYLADDYAKYNLTGGVKTASAATTGGTAPTGKIAAGQGFFIEANSALPNGSYTATFNNSMRVENENNQFFRSTESATVLQREKHRLWLNLSNASGAYDEMLVGYISGATNGLDAKYDGAIFPAGNAVSIYSIVGENSLAIQGRALPFSESDVIPVGYKSTIAGTMTISIESFDGIFTDTNVYLLDTSTGIMHDLKASPMSFTTAAGTFNSRFEIHFVGNALGTNPPIENAAEIVAFADGKQIAIKTANNTVHSVDIFDLTGKLLFSDANVDAVEYSLPLNIAPQLVLVQMTLDSETVIVRKVMIR